MESPSDSETQITQRKGLSGKLVCSNRIKCAVPSMPAMPTFGVNFGRRIKSSRKERPESGSTNSSVYDDEEDTRRTSSRRRRSNKKPEKRSIYDEYSIVQELGHGAFSRVYKGIHKESKRVVAIKVMAIDKYDDEMEDIVRNEIHIMKKVKRELGDSVDGIVQIEDVIREQGRVCIIMEFLSGGELFDRIVERKNYSEKDTAKIMSSIVESIVALHSRNIIHRDLKPENLVFLDNREDSPIKVMDFGLALVEGEEDPHKSVDYVGSPGYAAPEVLTAQKYSKENDTWSLGVLLYILLVGRPPFRGRTAEEQSAQVIAGKYSLKGGSWDKVSDNAKDLVKRMLDVNIATRIPLQDVLQHPFIVQNLIREKTNNLGSALPELKKTRDRMQLQHAAQRAIGNATADLRGRLLKLLEEKTANAAGLSTADLARIIGALQSIRGEGKITSKRFAEVLSELGFSYLPLDEIFELLARQSSNVRDNRTRLRQESEPEPDEPASNELAIEIDEVVVGLSVMAARESRDRVIEYLFSFLSDESKSLSSQGLAKILRVMASYESPENGKARRTHIAYSLAAIFGSQKDVEQLSFEEFKQGIIDFGDDVLQDFVFTPVRTIASTVASLESGIITKRPTIRKLASYLSRMATYSGKVNSAYTNREGPSPSTASSLEEDPKDT